MVEVTGLSPKNTGHKQLSIAEWEFSSNGTDHLIGNNHPFYEIFRGRGLLSIGIFIIIVKIIPTPSAYILHSFRLTFFDVGRRGDHTHRTQCQIRRRLSQAVPDQLRQESHTSWNKP